VASPSFLERRRIEAFRSASRIAALFVMVLGFAVLAGWGLGVAPLKSVLPGFATMKPSTALCFILAGLSLRLFHGSAAPRRRLAAHAAAAAVVVAGGLASIELATGRNLAILDPTSSGRMAPMTAANFIFVGAALLLLDRPRGRHVGAWLNGAAALLSAFALAGYFYNAPSLYAVSTYSSVALHTAVAFMVLCAGLLFARPERGVMAVVAGDGAGGVMARRLLPAAVAVPVLLGWLRMHGQRAGLYDTGFGLALFAVSNVVVFVTLIAWNARTLLHLDDDRARALETLRTQREHLRLVIETAPASIAMFDRDMRYLFVSARWMTDYALGDRPIIGRSHYEVFPEIPERWKEIHRRCLAGAVERSEEDAFPRADGTTDWVRWEIRPWRDERGTIAGIVIFSEVITARKRAELALRQTEEQLRHSQKMEAVGRLAGGIAHDFNNLLTVISGYGEVASESLPSADPARAHIAEILAAAARAANLTHQLLAFSRKQVLSPRVVNLNALVADTERLLRRLIGEDIALAAALSPDLGQVRVDASQVGQILMNLAVNARDAMPNGGRLTLETKNVELDETYAHSHPEVRPGRYVLLAVSDTGVGMDAETRARIFEPFFTTKERGKGTGLGLSTIYGIVKQSDGHIWVYSEPGHGATFKVYFPRVDAAPEPLPTAPRHDAPLRGHETVLVVEDDDSLRRLVHDVLRRHGYELLAARDGAEALALSGRHAGAIDLMITDVVMPGLGGRELARQLAPLRPAMKVLYVSGYTENAIVHHGQLDAGLEFLPKPFAPEELARKVRAILDNPSPRDA
jgi:PAS domain S-box-containing protein